MFLLCFLIETFVKYDFHTKFEYGSYGGKKLAHLVKSTKNPVNTLKVTILPPLLALNISVNKGYASKTRSRVQIKGKRC